MMNKLLLRVILFSLVLIVVICGCCYVLTHLSSSTAYSYKAKGTGYPISSAVDDSLTPYVNVTINGQSGYSNSTYARMFLNGTVSWVASEQDAVKSLSDIHLVMYTRVDDRQYDETGALTHLFIGSHIVAYYDEPTLPNDLIDHMEVIIPKIGLDTPTYQYSLNCSTFIEGYT
jgi:uncharacterized protein YceK